MTTQDTLGFTNMPVRFFIYDAENQDDMEACECNEQAFLEAGGVIEYERFTVFDNGCKQICLTKNPYV
jgi:hypothetical protein